VGIPYLYIATAATLADVTDQLGDRSQAEKYVQQAQAMAGATGLGNLFQQAPLPPAQPAVPLGGDTTKPAVGDSGRKP
jgi:hypothetical protein